MKGKLTLAQIRVILLLAAVLMIVLTYFLIFQRNMNQADEFETKMRAENKRIEYLTSLEKKVSDLEIYTSLFTGEIDGFIKSFPVKLTQQKSLYLIYRMMLDSGIDIESITAGNEAPFYHKGRVLHSEADQKQIQQEAEKEEPLSEIGVVSMEQMIGSKSNYTVHVSGATKDIYKALDWIRDSEEKLSIGSVNLQFDSSTGKLKGSIGINFYSMLGNGVPYSDPDIGEFTFGLDTVFGEFHNE